MPEASFKSISGLLCAAVLAIILALGLWPFHAPENEVARLKDRAGLGFGGAGSATSSSLLHAPESSESGDAIEIWLRPRRNWDSGTVLTFCSPEYRSQLLVRQSQADLELKMETEEQWRSEAANLSVKDFFRKTKARFATITSGGQGTSVYLDGTLVKYAPLYRLSTARLTGRIIIGDSAGQPGGWRGELYGLAIYHRELTRQEVVRHYVAWTQEGRPQTAPNERNVALYLFNEGAGNVVHNAAGPGLDLQIPKEYQVVDKIFLEPFWKEFSLTRSYLSAILKNILGFVPLGFCFYSYLKALRVRRAGLTTIILGGIVSVTIEVLQGYLPTRDSGTTDIITNTLGTWIGLTSFNVAIRLLPRIFPATLFGAASEWLECVTQVEGDRS